MWLQTVAVILFCFCTLGGCMIHSPARTKRQNLLVSDQNFATTFFNHCICVYQHQCDIDGFIITNGNLPSKKKKEERERRILCTGGKYEGELVCCKHKPGDEDKPPVPEAHTTPPEQIVCGRKLPTIDLRTFNDEDETVDGELPWLVAIFKKNTGSPQWMFHASGSLIHPGVILTSNHLVVSDKADKLKVIANGRIGLAQIGDNPLQERDVKSIIKHPDYNSQTLNNDVSLLLLKKPYDLAGPPALNTLCLNPSLTFANKRCLVAGWERNPTADEKAKVLRKVELPTHTHLKCQEMLAKALNESNYIFHESLMCAGGEHGKDSCEVDAGSPLMCSTGEDHPMYQVGIVAGGNRCGKKDVPGVFANVQFLHNWIVDELKERDIDL